MRAVKRHWPAISRQRAKLLADITTPLAAWFGEHPGSAWLNAEKACFAQLAGQIPAGHAVQFDLHGNTPEFISSSPAVFRHRFQVGSDGGFHGMCQGRLDELPLVSNSVQLLISHHSHEIGGQLDFRFSEWSRVLAANGTIVLFGFSAIGRRCDAPFADLDRLRPGQLSNKLRRVGLVPQRTRSIWVPGSRMDATLQQIQNRLPFAEDWVAGLAAGYLMSAKKTDNGAINLDLKRLQLKQVKQRVRGTAVG